MPRFVPQDYYRQGCCVVYSLWLRRDPWLKAHKGTEHAQFLL